MKDRIIKKMLQVNASYYFTEKPVILNGDYDNKYFICINGTHKIIKATKTLREMDEWLNDELEEQELEECIYKAGQAEREELIKAYETEQKEQSARMEAEIKIWEAEEKTKMEEMARAWDEEWKAKQARMEELLKSEEEI